MLRVGARCGGGAGIIFGEKTTVIVLLRGLKGLGKDMISVKVEGLKELLAALDPKRASKAAFMALNDAARAGRTVAAREIRSKFNIKTDKLNTELKNVKFASADSLIAVIQAKGRPISLTYYGAKEVREVKGRGVLVQTRKSGKIMKRSRATRGVTVQITRGRITTLQKSFIATTKSGHIGVFRRLSKSRLPIMDMATVTIATMFGQEKVQAATIKAVKTKWAERLKHHIERMK